MKNHQYSAVLFDLDGTLLDTANDLGEALNYVLEKYNLPLISREKYRPVASDGALGLLKLGFGEQLANYDYETLRQEFLQYYISHLAVHTCLYPGVEILLTDLDSHHIPWGIVTNKPEAITRKLLPNFNILSSSQTMVGGDTLATRKPDPAPLLFACQQMAINANSCIYVGDAPRDIEAGNRANMFSIIAEWGYILDKKICNDWNANAIATTPEEILPYIL